MGRRFSSNCLPIYRYSNQLTPPVNCFNENNNGNGSPFFDRNNNIGLSEIDINHLLKDTPQEIAQSIDRKCRYLFPSAFILFNLIYWCYL